MHFPNDNTWRVATLSKKEKVAHNVMGLWFDVPGWIGHKRGQHVDVRLTAPNGYQAERSYSLANPVNGNVIELGVELLENGEVSPFLWQLNLGEQVEIRGPIGGHFIWDRTYSGPLVLIAGGSGMVPLMSMLRLHERDEKNDRDVIFLISARDLDRVLYINELEQVRNNDSRVKIYITLTNNSPSDWSGYKRRIDKEMFGEVLMPIKDLMPMVYICGPTKFVEAASRLLIDLNFNSHEIRTERFGGA